MTTSADLAEAQEALTQKYVEQAEARERGVEYNRLHREWEARFFAIREKNRSEIISTWR